MKITASFVLSTILALFFTFDAASANAPTCGLSNGTPYCQYDGRVLKAYVNSSNTILLYIDTPFDLSVATAVGYTGITATTALAIDITENPEFAKMAYSAMLAAQARGVIVTVQMRGRVGGYAKIDRIWSYE